MSNTLTNIVSPQTRKIVYAVFAVVGLLLGSLQVWFATVEGTQPDALTGALAVFAFLGTALGSTAASNTDPYGYDDDGDI